MAAVAAFLEELIAHADYAVQDATIREVVEPIAPADTTLVEQLGPHAAKWWRYHQRHRGE